MAETKKKNSGSLPVGTILRNGQYQYRIGEVLGQGNYGITYKASAMVKIGNISKPMTFAVKENFAKDYCSRKADGVTLRYAEEHAEEAERDLREFIAEGKTLERICNGHENIVNVNETFEENNTAYYVMEFIEGGDLQSLVRSKGRLTETEAISIISPIIDAVAHIHNNRRLHLDIKPENIVLKKDGTPILIDFGITLHFNADGSRSGTSKDKSGGLSEGYAPMEQYLGVTTFAPEIDVYALGATLYYLLVGKDPAKASDISPKRIEANLPADMSSPVRYALLHAMAKLAEDRTQTANAFKAEILSGKPKKGGKDKGVTNKLTINSTGNGETIYGSAVIRNSSRTFNVPKSSSFTLSFSPDANCSIESVKVNDAYVTSRISNNQYTISDFTADKIVNVTYKNEEQLIENWKDEKGNWIQKYRYYLIAAFLLVVIFCSMFLSHNNSGRTNISPKEISYTPCPDGNHPHMIDLGLPSGTKWACCNLGATTPEGYGDYYRWGETKPTKDEDTYKTYQYWHDKNGNGKLEDDEYDNLGDNIAGTKYDAATANWGASWRMPTGEQIEELVDNCTYEWKNLNGVEGGEVTGLNGNAIFIPAAGSRNYRSGTTLNGVGYYCDCWSSSDYTYDSARYLRLYGTYFGWNYNYRAYGFSVRPVAK